ncbi:MAG: CHAT domain-containing protein [Bacteroidota bacterium]
MRPLFIISLLFVGLQLSAQPPAFDLVVDAYKSADYERTDSILQDLAVRFPLADYPEEATFIELYRGEVAYELGEESQAADHYLAAERIVENRIAQPQRLDFYYRILQGRVATLSDKDEKDACRQLLADQVLAHQSDQAEPMADAYQALAWIAWNDKEYALSLGRLDTALTYAHTGYTPGDLGQLYANLSSAYYALGDEERALISQQLATRLTDQPIDQAINLLHEGEFMTDLRRYKAATDRFDRAARIMEENGIADDVYRQYLCFSMQLASELDDWPSFDLHLEKLEESFDQLASPFMSSYYEEYFIYGASKAVRQADFTTAEEWLDRYQQVFQPRLAGERMPISYDFLKSKVFAGKAEFDQAIDLLAETIVRYQGDHLSSDHLTWQVHQFYPDNQTAIWIKDLASYYLKRFNHTGDEDDILPATYLLDLTEELITLARRLNYQFGNRIELNETAKEIVTLRMSIYRRQYLNTQSVEWAKRAFQASAAVKQRWVSDRQHDYWLRTQMNLDEELLAQEERLSTELNAQMRIAEGVLSELDISTLEEVRKRVDSLRELQSTLERNIQDSLSEYAVERYKTPSVHIDSIRKTLLDEHEVLLQFFEIDTAVYTVILRADTIHLTYSPLLQPLSERIPKLMRQLDERALGAEVFEELHALYQEIFEPLLPLIDTADLLIIPDGYLWYLPVDGLITKLADSSPEHYFAHRYMIQDRRSRFHLNALLGWLSTDTSDRDTLERTAVQAYCPMVATGFDGFSALPRSENTAEMLRNQMHIPRAQIKMGDQATEEQLVQAIQTVGLLHLGTHAEVKPEHSGYSFLQLFPTDANDGRLYAHELAEMRTDIELAVLMACRTADGKLYRGQGVANLGRDMMRGGTKGLILNRWRVNDDMSRRLMAHFYPALLLEGHTPSDALRSAQLQQLKDEATAHPADWATVFYTGRNHPILLPEKSSGNWWLILSTTGISLYFFLFFLGKRIKLAKAARL